MFSRRKTVRRNFRSRIARMQLLHLESRTVPANLVVTSSADDGGAQTLRGIINTANTNGEADTITFGAGVSVINLTAGQISYAEGFDLSINGPLSGNLAINNTAAASATSRIFTFAPTAAVNIALSSMTIAGGNVSSGDGGAVTLTTAQNATFTNVVFNNNKVTAGNAGALAVTGASTIVLNNCTFSGNSASLAGGAFRTATASTNVSISGTTFSGNTASGSGGGGAIIFNLGVNIAISQSTFSNNTTGGPGGAINFNNTVNSAGSPGTITTTVFSNNKAGNTGGGAFRFAPGGSPPFPTVTLNLDSCTISGNSTTNGPGGGVFLQSSGALTFANCTLSGNAANTTAAAINGGGLSASNGGDTVTFTNCTIAGNSTGGTVGGGGVCISSASFTGQLNLRNSTIDGNTATGGKGGGVFVNSAGGTVTLSSTVLAGNTNATNRDLGASAARNVGGDNNLVGAVDGSLITLTGTNDAIRVGTEASPVVAGILPLDFYGGPTMTQPPTTGSKLLDAGNNLFTLSTDQRGTGFPRVLNGTADIGAAEGVLPAPFISGTTIANVTTAGATTYTFSVTYQDETGINVATLGDGELSVVGPNMFFIATPTLVSTSGSGKSITATYQFTPPGGNWDITDDRVYTVNLAANKVFDTDVPFAHAAFAQIVGTFNVLITGTIVVDNKGDADDGNCTAGNLTLREAVAISNNSGGLADTITFAPTLNNQTITLGGTALTITDPVVIQGPGPDKLTLSGNNASRLYTFNITGLGAESTFSGLTLSNGQAASGGAISLADDALALSNVIVTQNASTTGGGAVNISGGSLKVTDSTISLNNAAGVGGGINATGNTSITVTRSTLSGNTTTVNGGAIYSNSGSITVNDSTISGNTSTSTFIGGGGIAGTTPVLTITNSTISGNLAANGTAVGGGIRLGSNGTLTIANSTITNNTAAAGGGGIAFSSFTSLVTIDSTIIAQNTDLGSNDPDLYSSDPGILTIFGTDNLEGVNNEINIGFFGATTGDIITPLDVMLAPLANNGGHVLTHRPMTGSPAINGGANSLSLPNDERGAGYLRSVGQTDVGAYEVQPPATVAAVMVNDGSIQRSRVTSVTVTFSQLVNLPVTPATAFTLKRQSDNALPTLLAAVSNNGQGTVVTLTFAAGASVDFGSLADGRYTLTIDATKVSNPDGTLLDGNGDSTAGDDYVLIGAPNTPTNLFRLFGDANGSGNVDVTDFATFRGAFGTNNNAFDFDNDGDVDASDFGAFRARFGVAI